MRPLLRFRLLVAVIVLVAGSFALGNLYAELLRASPPYSLTTAKIPTDDQIAAAARAAVIAPLRTDLKAELARMLAGTTESQAMGARARVVFENEAGATERAVQALVEIVAAGSPIPAPQGAGS